MQRDDPLSWLHGRVEGENSMSLSYLAALEELTVVGDKCMHAANTYLYQQQAQPGPLLPASLQVLRLGSSDEAWLEPFRWHLDYHAAAPEVIPTLELRAQNLALNLAISTSTAQTRYLGSSSLPKGFASLWIRAERIRLDAAETLGKRPCGMTADRICVDISCWRHRATASSESTRQPVQCR